MNKADLNTIAERLDEHLSTIRIRLPRNHPALEAENLIHVECLQPLRRLAADFTRWTHEEVPKREYIFKNIYKEVKE